MIDRSKKAMEYGEAAKDDLLGMLLNCPLKEIQAAAATNKMNQQLISLQEVTDYCKLFYLAGQETASMLLVWTLILLSKHQDWQARAQEEVLQTFRNNAPHNEGFNHLKTDSSFFKGGGVCDLGPTELPNQRKPSGLRSPRPKKLERWLKQQGLPGTSYKILFGDLKDLSSMRSQAMAKPMSSFSHNYLARIEPFRHQLMTKLGKQHFMWLGTKPIVTISKPELIREALTKIQEFRKPSLHPIVDKLFAGFINYEAFCESCGEMINKWEKIVAEADSREVDVWPHLVRFSADVISRAAFGTSYADGQKIFELLKEQIGLALSMLQSIYFPGLRYIPTARNRRFKKINDHIQTLLRGIIDKRKKAIEAGEAAKADLLDILIDFHIKEIQQAAATNNKNQKPTISLQEVIDDCKLFYLAGQETTSILLVWTLILLSKHQDWQARAREEVLQTFGNNAPDFEGLNHLKTVAMILNEVLRMYPPATQLSRRIYKDTKLGELSLPAGALVNFQVLYIHRDEDLWGEDAEEFEPERFSEGISKATRGNNAFFPFGWGPRICIGEKFATTEAKMALSMILQRFSWELSPSYAHSPITVFFLQPQHGAQIMLHRLT
ncbi:hypothetical protein Cgig2_006222 [Carnegiea gigantea]|uniref:Cytochrome P450 n=1 Tax=Carnegiea gigantea TaxID=171969 RepID=A0A9Q1L1K1_9CARY|nr:hypothetical protein Cgig2_006222 [Carnegiea gigantea]